MDENRIKLIEQVNRWYVSKLRQRIAKPTFVQDGDDIIMIEDIDAEDAYRAAVEAHDREGRS